MAANALLSAKVLTLKTVRIYFGNGGSPDTFTTPGVSGEVEDELAWSAVCAGPFPAYTPRIVSAVLSGLVSVGVYASIDLTTDSEFTDGAVYTFSNVAMITDFSASHDITIAASNLLNPPAARDFALIDFVPAINVADDTSGDMANFIKVLQEALNQSLFDVDHWIDILDSDLAPEAFLDLILRDLANPFVFAKELPLIKKRRLASLLVEIYKLKGTLKGVQEAISLFLGMRSEFTEFNGLGDKLDDGNELGDELGHPGTPPFFLGGGGPWRLLIKVGTTVASQTDAGAASPSAGGALTAEQIDQILQIVKVMKPAHLVLVLTGSGFVRWGCTLSKRNAIQRTNGTTAKLFMEPVSGADHYAFLQSDHPGTQEFNSTSVGPVTAVNALLGTSVVHGGTFHYWNGVAESTGQPAWDTIGLLGNEVTNALLTGASGATVLSVVAHPRFLRLTWTAVIGATRYRIYRSTASMASPVVADNAEEPIEVAGDLLTYDDAQESGVLRHYIVTPVAADSEGFFSNDASGTAL